LVSHFIQKSPSKSPFHFQDRCGLPFSTYFSALKLKWLLDNVDSVKQAASEKRLCFGTMDSWLIYKLTGGAHGGVHVTDATNASRTMLMNLKTLQWDPELCHFFDIPMDILPEIRSSAEVYGYVSEGPFKQVPIAGVIL
jgi:glycerol kinase